MSLKAIEMQIAIPRTGDAGIHQNQLLQKPVADQASLAASILKQTEEKRKKSNKVDESSDSLKTDREDRNKGNHNKSQQINNKQQNNDGTTVMVEHPYKGQHIDLSL